MKKKVIAIAINLALVLTLGVITTLHTQFAFARVELTPDFWDIESVNSTGYTVCNPSCHLSNNSLNGNSARNMSVLRQRTNLKRWNCSVSYGKRWMVETVFSCIKRMFGEYVNARKFHNMTKELIIKASLYNMFVAMRR